MPKWDPELIRRYGGHGPRYTSYPTALQFHEDVGRDEYEAAVQAGNEQQRPLSLYFHIPFCDTVCYYCACNRIITGDRTKADSYIQYLQREMDLHTEQVDTNRPVVQLHWGGGTPTYLEDSQATLLMFQTGRRFNLLDKDQGDYSIELDPRSVDGARLGLLRGLGFNRVSLGVQDLDPRVQKAVNRVQPESMIRDRVAEVREYDYHSLSMDLILGLPCQSEGSLAVTLEKIIDMRPDRLSVFNYAHMPDRFKVQRQIDEDTMPSPQEKLRMLIRAGEMLEQAGYVYVGMDHFALPDDELARAQKEGTLHRNFQGYTLRGDADLVALGTSAISQIGPLYLQNHKEIGPWQAALDDNGFPFARGYKLTRDDEIRRELILRLLCDMELDVAAFEERWGIDFCDYFPEECRQVRELAEEGLVDLDDEARALTITEQGRLFARAVAMAFDRHQSGTGGTEFSRII